jgi:hypothetical protein
LRAQRRVAIRLIVAVAFVGTPAAGGAVRAIIPLGPIGPIRPAGAGRAIATIDGATGAWVAAAGMPAIVSGWGAFGSRRRHGLS